MSKLILVNSESEEDDNNEICGPDPACNAVPGPWPDPVRNAVSDAAGSAGADAANRILPDPLLDGDSQEKTCCCHPEPCSASCDSQYQVCSPCGGAKSPCGTSLPRPRRALAVVSVIGAVRFYGRVILVVHELGKRYGLCSPEWLFLGDFLGCYGGVVLDHKKGVPSGEYIMTYDHTAQPLYVDGSPELFPDYVNGTAVGSHFLGILALCNEASPPSSPNVVFNMVVKYWRFCLFVSAYSIRPYTPWATCYGPSHRKTYKRYGYVHDCSISQCLNMHNRIWGYLRHHPFVYPCMLQHCNYLTPYGKRKRQEMVIKGSKKYSVFLD